MGVLIPSILVSNQKELERELALLKGLVTDVQIDIVDGVFAKPPTWPYAQPQEVLPLDDPDKTLHQWGGFGYEIDLMVQNPEEVAGTWITLGAKRVVIHVESTQYLPQLLTTFSERYGHDKNFAPDLLSIGFSVNITTDASVLDQYVEQIDYVQFMGIAEIGRQGVPFDSRVIDKIKAFKKAHPDIPVQVDGGVSLETAPLLLSAGADRLIVGSALWKSGDLKATIEHFNHLGESYGLYA